MTGSMPGGTAPSLATETEGAVVEELVPASARKAKFERGDRPLLEVTGLHTSFRTRDGVVKAVDGIDFHVDRGEIMGLVGESGCGKSVTSLSIMGLVGQPGKVDAGEIIFDGRDLLKLKGDDMRKLRGDRISMIFQQPQSSLNPVRDVGRQIGEVLELHRDMKRGPARARALELLRMVGIPDPERRLKSYPHEMSGGMAQRVRIAMALASEPELLIADEPTTALDVTIQAQILELLRDLRARLGMAVMLISHDLGVVAEFASRVIVMYAGRVVEDAPVDVLFRRPLHPYTEGLMASVPAIEGEMARLYSIPGRIPDPDEAVAGCRFGPRCGYAEPVCRAAVPDLVAVDGDHRVRCTPRSRAAGVV
jgi:oligopeptide/dipeptide ABC transporter ATP-binding protein